MTSEGGYPDQSVFDDKLYERLLDLPEEGKNIDLAWIRDNICQDAKGKTKRSRLFAGCYRRKPFPIFQISLSLKVT